jgi:HPt (histidine-containing phosphotransfer) domain-containing protein/CheY-like chemotaxis protein
MNLDLKQFIDEFYAETADNLKAMDTALLKLENHNGDAQAQSSAIRTLFLNAHTIKGSAAMLGFEAVRDLTHALEDALARLRDGKEQLTPARMQVLFVATDAVRALIQATDSADLGPHQPLLQVLRLGGGLEVAAVPTPAVSTPAVSTPAVPIPVPTPAVPIPVPAVKPPMPTTARHQGGDLERALVIEPSQTARQLLTWQLEDAGLAVDAVASVERAREYCQRSQPGLIVASGEAPGLTPTDLRALGQAALIVLLLDPARAPAWQVLTTPEWQTLGGSALLAYPSPDSSVLTHLARRLTATTAVTAATVVTAAAAEVQA